MMKMRVIKKKVNQWRLRQRLKDNPHAQKAVARASSLSAVTSNAFQIILERIYRLRDIQNEQSDRPAALRDEMNILSAKFDSFTTQ